MIPPQKTLHEIACEHQPSKIDHGYDKHIFPIYFEKRRNEELVIIELGVKHGRSLIMWADYFPNAEIVGVDIRDPGGEYAEKCARHPRVHFYKGQQQDHDLLQKICKEIGTPDFVVDDGSHRSRHQIPTFNYLFRKMNRKGVYVVEDLHFFSHTEKGASWQVNPKDGFVDQHDFVEYLHSFAPYLILGSKGWGKVRPMHKHDIRIGKSLKGIHWYSKIVVVEKL